MPYSMISRPLVSEYAPYYQTYISKVDDDVTAQLVQQSDELVSIIEENESKLNYAYAEGKWTLRQVVMHLLDTEQVFAYRLLRISRGDSTELPGFDQDVFIENNDFTHLDAGDLIRMIESQRSQTFSLINSLTTDKYELTGTASDNPVSTRALIYMIAGHMHHHLEIINDRYL